MNFKKNKINKYFFNIILLIILCIIGYFSFLSFSAIWDNIISLNNFFKVKGYNDYVIYFIKFLHICIIYLIFIEHKH